VVLGLDMSGGRPLYFLVDSGADVSLVKSEKLLSAVEFEPRDRVGVKSVGGSVVETDGSVEGRILEGELNVPIVLQLVSKQVDLKGDGILGRDFLRPGKPAFATVNGCSLFRLRGHVCKRG